MPENTQANRINGGDTVLAHGMFKTAFSLNLPLLADVEGIIAQSANGRLTRKRQSRSHEIPPQTGGQMVANSFNAPAFDSRVHCYHSRKDGQNPRREALEGLDRLNIFGKRLAATPVELPPIYNGPWVEKNLEIPSYEQYVKRFEEKDG